MNGGSAVVAAGNEGEASLIGSQDNIRHCFPLGKGGSDLVPEFGAANVFLVRAHDKTDFGKGLPDGGGVPFYKGAELHHTVAQMDIRDTIPGKRPHLAQDFFRIGKGGTAGAADNARQAQVFFSRIIGVRAFLFLQVSKADNGTAVQVLSCVGTGDDAQSSRFHG